MRPATLRTLALAWVAVACAVPLALSLKYAFQVFGGLPLYDDWAFLERVRQYAQREVGLEHVFDRHNGHPSVPARVGYLVVFRFNDMDIAPLRWAALIGNMACVAAMAAMLVRAAAGASGEGRRRIDPLHPAIAVGIPLSAGLFLSLGHWETYSVAMCVGNVIVTFCAIVGILVFDMWLKQGRRVLLGAALAFAAAATFSMTQGVLLWLVYALMLAVQPDWKRRRALGGVLLTVFIAVLVWNLAGFGSSSGVQDTKNLVQFLMGPFILQGAPVAGFINNAVVLPFVATIGVMVAGAMTFTLIASVLAGRANLSRQLPFLALMLYGAGTSVLIAWGRQSIPLELMGSSRYAELVAPSVAGLAGVLCVSGETRRWASHMLAGLFTVAVVGLAVTNLEENEMAKYRAILFDDLDRKLRDPAQARDAEWFMKELFVNPEFGAAAERALPFLETHRQSIFSRRAPEKPPQ